MLKGPVWDDVEAPTPKMSPEDLSEVLGPQILNILNDFQWFSFIVFNVFRWFSWARVAPQVAVKATVEDLKATVEDREETTMVCATLDDDLPEHSPSSSPVRGTMTPAELVAVSPARRRNSVKITDFSRAKMSDMSEKILEMHTTEYYKWGVPWPRGRTNGTEYLS